MPASRGNWIRRLFALESLKARLTLWVFLPFTIIVFIDLAVSYHSSGQIATLMQQQLLHGSAAMISEQLTINEGNYELSAPPAAFDLLKNRFKDRVSFAVYTRDGLLIAGDDLLPPFSRPLAMDEEVFFPTTLRGEGVRVVAYAYVIPSSPSSDFVITQVAQTMRNHDEFRDELWYATIRRHFLLLTITVVLFAIAFRWMLKPLVEFSGMLAARQPGSLVKLDENAAPSELRPVIHAMNDYVQRLDYTLQSYEKFVADTAHHLRNSFAVITTQVNFAKRSSGADAVQQEVLGAAQKALGKSTRVINQLLMLAALAQPKKDSMPSEKTNLATVVTSVIEELAPLAQQKDIELGVDALDDNVVIPAPRRLLYELLTNLIGNAIQHMQKPGQVTVTLTSGKSGAELAVADNGIGIPEKLREKVFDRFYRIDESNPNGSGLGMAIVKEICDSIDAAISLSTPAEGSGLQVNIRFPLKAKKRPADDSLA